MKVRYFYTILKNPKEINDLSEIQKIAQQYPYFPIPQMLSIAFLYQNNDNQFVDTLKKFSHNISNRKHFFQKLKELYTIPSSTTSQTHTISSTSENIEKNPSIQNINSPTTHSIQANTNNFNISKEINKSISESITQTELFQIDPNLKNKIDTLKENSNSTATISSQSPTQTENINNPTIKNNNTSNNLPPNALSRILKQLQNNSLSPTTHTKDNKNSLIDKLDKKEKIKQQQEIIDKIISNPPKSIKVTESKKFYSAENKAKESLLESEDLVTETLAQIYIKQGNIHKAIRAYEILSLKFPQKNTYFAAKIQKLKNQLKQ